MPLSASILDLALASHRFCAFVCLHMFYASAMLPPHNGSLPIVTLSNGQVLPLVGLGCAQGLRTRHVLSALQAGYRHLDTAQEHRWGYHEEDVGEAVEKSSLPRGDVHIQTKVRPQDLGYHSTENSLKTSLERLRTGYVDSVLIHKPTCFGGVCSNPEGTWQDSWRALEEAYDAGQVRAIGICDVSNGIMDELLRQRHKPHIIQNWMDPLHQDKSMRARCQKEGIQYQAYSTLGTQWLMQGHRQNPVLTNPTLRKIAAAHQREVAQVIINWATRHGVAVIPASKSPSRQQSNLASFDFNLSDEEMSIIDSLDGKAPEPDQQREDTLEVVFENPGQSTVKCFYVDEQSHETFIGDLAVAGGQLRLRTFAGHRFRFKHAGQAFFEHVMSTGHASSRTVVLPLTSAPAVQKITGQLDL
mmetsp:Transcript_121863/g.235053  ORF Transcript_121863/g.235053 Transcript_121863/m.235053 type:complete len:415 (+) Transcript_121863:37-1281(+)